MARPRSSETHAKLVLQARIKSQFFDRAKVRKALEKANYEALRKAGRDIQEASKRGIGQAAPRQTKAGRKAVKAGAIVEFVGGLYQDLTMLGSGKPRPAGKPIKSWAPKRFAYRDVMFFWDDAKKSVVIGALKADWLGRLHEFGGSLVLRAYRIGVGAARNAYLRRRGFRGQGRDERGRFTTNVARGNQYKYGALIWSNKPLKSKRNWEATSITKVARYPARPYMQGAAGVQKVVARIRERFRNTLRKAG
jgi:phage gpG-like protein